MTKHFVKNQHIQLTDEKRGTGITNRCLTTDVREKGFYLKAWRAECEFDIEYKDNHNVQISIDSLTSKSDGQFEIDIHVSEKPNSNVFSYDIVTKNLDFFYQPALTQQEIENGDFRPDNVVGSYAVYHSTKSDNFIGKDGIQYNYGTGKVFHIYRPEAIDNDGKRVWCELNIKNSKLLITVPQEFLDTAVYPIIIDPIFGKTVIGASGTDASEFLHAYKLTTPATDITNAYLRSISYYVSSLSSGPHSTVWGLYTGTGTGNILANTKILQNAGDTDLITTTSAWYTTVAPFVGAINSITSETFPTALSGSTGYWAVNQSDATVYNSIRGSYDDVGSVERNINITYGHANYPTLPADFGVAGISHTRRISVYATYYIVETGTITSDAHIGSVTPYAEHSAWTYVEYPEFPVIFPTPTGTGITPFLVWGEYSFGSTLNSNAVIGTGNTVTILSDSQITHETVSSDAQITHETILSDAYMGAGTASTSIGSDAFILIKIYSNAYISTTQTIIIKEDGTGNYTSLGTALTAEAANLPSIGRKKIFEIQGSWTNPDSATRIRITAAQGWVTNATYNIEIITTGEARHAGKWTSTAWRMQNNTYTYLMNIGCTHIKLDGLQLYNTNITAASCTTISSAFDTPTLHEINSCIIRGANSAGVTCYGILGNSTNGCLRVTNCVIYGYHGSGGAGIYVNSTNSGNYVYNNTIADATLGIRGSLSGLDVAKNNIIYNCTAACANTFATGTDYNATDLPSMGYIVTG